MSSIGSQLIRVSLSFSCTEINSNQAKWLFVEDGTEQDSLSSKNKRKMILTLYVMADIFLDVKE